MTPKQDIKMISKAIAIASVFLCVVFTPSIKSYLTDNSDKKTTEILLDKESNLSEDGFLEEELFNKQESNDLVLNNRFVKSPLQTFYKCIFNTLQPYLKINTPPPDFLLF